MNIHNVSCKCPRFYTSAKYYATQEDTPESSNTTQKIVMYFQRPHKLLKVMK